MVKNMKTTLTEKINWTKYNLAYPELGDVIQMIRTGDMQLHDNEFGEAGNRAYQKCSSR